MRHGRFAVGPFVLFAALVASVAGAVHLTRATYAERNADSSTVLAAPQEDAEAPVQFTRDIRPILSNNCYVCHGPDDQTRAQGLRLDVAEDAFEYGAIIPGNAAESPLIQRVTAASADDRMPPADTNKELTEEQIALLHRWIDEGAEYERHWSFTAPEEPELPEVANEAWARNGIDRFVLARLEAEDMEPAPEADRRALIRRVSLDLTGLPPDPERVEAFVNDEAPDAYERLVDELLDSPHYGERWARPWLDIARYADTQGYEKDHPRTIWRYRDWVIDALNADMPFDQFTIEQLAGDLLPDPTIDQLLATAFHRNTMTNTEGGTDAEEFRVAAVVDRVNTTGTAWMGLTVSCAQCHTHKYDPITHADYYSLYDFFNQTADEDRDDERPTLVTPTPAQQAKAEELEAERERLRAWLAGEAEWPQEEDAESLEERAAALDEEIEAFEASLPTTPVMEELPEEERRDTHILIRGEFQNYGDQVTADIPDIFGEMSEDYPRNRLGLAKWLVDGDNPLTARVQVNRYWYTLFGRGIVPTVEDFGLQGDLPSHPELLDWLALQFSNELEWSMKELCRLIVTSATYRQSSRATPELLEADPQNELLARGPRFRLEAEQVRDQALAVSGLLNDELAGPSVLPHQPAGTLTPQAFSDYVPELSEGDDRYRRGLYTFWRRTGHYPSFAMFDAPARQVCNIERVRTNTPLQALVTLNDPVYVEAAQALARRIIREAGAEPAERIRRAYELTLARPPQDAELDALLALYEDVRARYAQDPSAAGEMATDPLGPLPDDLAAEEAAAWTVVSNVVMNLDEFLTKG